MITDIFTIEMGKVIPTIHCYTIPELKKIIEYYPDSYVDVLAYCFYMSCPYKSDNPYADFSQDEKEEVLQKDYSVFYPDDQNILDAIDKLQKHYATKASKYLEVNRENLDAIMDYLRNTPLVEGRDGNLGDRIKIAEKCGRIMTEYLELESQAEEEKKKARVKANRKIGLGELDA